MKRRQFFQGLLLGGLLLTACGAQEPSAPLPAPSHSLYQLDFQVGGEQGVAAKAQQVHQGLKSQALENGPGTLALDTQPVMTTGFVTRRNGTSYRHITATFTVTNNTAQSMRNLTFLPVVRADLDGDPANNPVAATVPGTPFMGVRRFDGSDASDQAGTLKVVQAQQVAVESGTVAPLPGASRYLTSLDVSGLSVSAPAGMTTTVMNSGWVAATELPANASTRLTVAVEFPLDPNQPALQPYTFSLLLTDAQDVTGTGVGTAVDAGRVLGIIQDWTFRAGEFLTLSDDYGGRIGDIGPIAENGQVDARLPTPAPQALTPFLGSCSWQGEMSVADFSFFARPMRAHSADGDLLGDVQETTLDGEPVGRMYSESDARVKGMTAACAYAGTTLFDLSLKRGWNAIKFRVDAVSGRQIVESLPIDTRTTLRFTQATPGIDILGDVSGMRLSTGGAGVTHNMTFRQTGGLSGEFTLETDVPGVSVSPSTINLTSLQAASLIKGKGLSAQALNTPVTFVAAGDAANYSGSMNLLVKNNGVVVGQRTFYSITVQRPIVQVNGPFEYTYSPLQLSPGQSTTVNVTLNTYSYSGAYSGPVTVTFLGLPQGVTASTETVTLTPDTPTFVSVVLTASPSALPGPIADATYSVTGGAFQAVVFTSPLKVQVVP